MEDLNQRIKNIEKNYIENHLKMQQRREIGLQREAVLEYALEGYNNRFGRSNLFNYKTIDLKTEPAQKPKPQQQIQYFQNQIDNNYGENAFGRSNLFDFSRKEPSQNLVKSAIFNKNHARNLSSIQQYIPIDPKEIKRKRDLNQEVIVQQALDGYNNNFGKSNLFKQKLYTQSEQAPPPPKKSYSYNDSYFLKNRDFYLEYSQASQLKEKQRNLFLEMQTRVEQARQGYNNRFGRSGLFVPQ